MKVTFFSNFLNHHQLPFCLKMYEILGDNFKFIATEPIHKERIKLGYVDMSTLYPFSLNTYSNSENKEMAIKLGQESDVVLMGSAPSWFIKNRLKENKVTFYYSERLFKKGRWRVLNPRTIRNLYVNHIKYKENKVYMLCASAYTAADFKLVGAYRGKTYKWGYFPKVESLDIEDVVSKKEKEIPKLLWVGRFIDWKHPDEGIKLAYLLKKEGYKFTLDIIGTGEMEGYLKKLINQYKLSDKVNILGSMNPEKVRDHMKDANIFLFTSDFNEGWGAVLNEAMSSGCAVVASHAIGSAPFLIRNKENGLIYKNGDLNHLKDCVEALINDSNLCKRLGKEAYNTIYHTWNSEKAAERFIKLSESMITGNRINFNEGPCSVAEITSHKYNV